MWIIFVFHKLSTPTCHKGGRISPTFNYVMRVGIFYVQKIADYYLVKIIAGLNTTNETR